MMGNMQGRSNCPKAEAQAICRCEPCSLSYLHQRVRSCSCPRAKHMYEDVGSRISRYDCMPFSSSSSRRSIGSLKKDSANSSTCKSCFSSSSCVSPQESCTDACLIAHLGSNEAVRFKDQHLDLVHCLGPARLMQSASFQAENVQPRQSDVTPWGSRAATWKACSRSQTDSGSLSESAPSAQRLTAQHCAQQLSYNFCL